MSMEKSEIICISSDDDGEIQQNKEDIKYVLSSGEQKDSSVINSENVSDNDNKQEACKQKRRLSQTSESHNGSVKKKIKVSADVNNIKECANNVIKDNNEIASTSRDKKHQVLKPQLVIKEKKSIEKREQDIFPMFISLCLQRDRSAEMQLIVNKLKRRYEQLNSAYANSEAFINFLNEKRNDIMNSNQKLFVHIQEVMNEMKDSCRGKSTLLTNQKYSNHRSLNNNVSTHDVIETENALYEDDKEDDTTERKIKLILQTMKKCEKYIKILEEKEVDFNDEDNSHYIKLERYKHRMVELFNKYCEYTGENSDAGRSYLRPKHLSTTGIVAVDQAITNFINSKISKRKKLGKIGAFADALIFPDYSDILQCVSRCNELHNLGLNKIKQQQIAKKAFIQLGEYLQRVRREDYWDTFSLFLEQQDDDPAVKDPSLRDKLTQNKSQGEKNLSKVFQEYTKKQEELKDQLCNEEISTENEEDDEESIVSEDEDSKNWNDDLSDEKSSIDADKNSDQDESDVDNNKISADKTALKEDTTNNLVKDSTNTEHMTQNENLNTSRTALCTNDEKIGIVKETESSVKCSAPDEKQVSKSEEKEVIDSRISAKVGSLPKVNSSDANSPTNTVNTVDTVDTEEDPPNITCEKSTKDKLLVDVKPLLRVRSFAKPPTTWEDGCQKREESGSDKKASKVPIKNIVMSVSHDRQKQNPLLTKCATLQIGSKIIPLKEGKYRTLVIPVNTRNVINVKNITNHYVRLNTQGTNSNNLINATKLQAGQVLTPVQHVVGMNSGSTIIKLPSNKPSDRQVSNTNVTTKNSQGRHTNAFIQIIQPTKTILVPLKTSQNILQPSTKTSETRNVI